MAWVWYGGNQQRPSKYISVHVARHPCSSEHRAGQCVTVTILELKWRAQLDAAYWTFKIAQMVPNLPFVCTGFRTTTFSYHKRLASNEIHFPLKIISKSSSLTYSGKWKVKWKWTTWSHKFAEISGFICDLISIVSQRMTFRFAKYYILYKFSYNGLWFCSCQ